MIWPYFVFLSVALQILLSEGVDSKDYTHLGCFKDSFIRSMSESLSMNIESVDECARIVRRKGYSTFGVQNGKECYSKADAAAKYNSQGVASNCANGMGGIWANDVYQFKDSNNKNLGCWKDKMTRALPTYTGKFDKTAAIAIRTCADYTRSNGYSVFGVQNGGECYIGENGASTYAKYGNASNCAADGTGGSLANSVYQLPAQKCFSCNAKDNCSKITCGASGAYCYNMSADNEMGDAERRTTLAGCMSSCTNEAIKEGCAGKKNCHLSCCAYENCNDPNAPNYLPKCYACKSNISMADCTANQYLLPCGNVEGAQSHCYTAYNKGSYWKGCADDDYVKCTIQAGMMCANVDETVCSMKCCSGLACNSAIKAGVSVFLILTCALIMFVTSL